MSDQTKIEWTDATWSPITGCSVHSAGCTNCYAMRLAGGRLKHHASRAGLTQDSKAGPVWNGEVRFNEVWLDQPLHWKKPRMVFVCAHADLFHENVPDEWIDRVFAVMALCPQHTFQVLTKRSDRMREYLTAPGILVRFSMSAADHMGVDFVDVPDFAWPLPNVWLGVSVEDQAAADARIPDLLETPAAMRFVSVEPLLGPVDLRWIAQPDEDRSGVIDALIGRDWVGTLPPWGEEFAPFRPGHADRALRRQFEGPPFRALDWVICGGESGKGARPMHPDWARSLRDQCAAADVPFFFKQWGEHVFLSERYPSGYANMDAVANLYRKYPQVRTKDSFDICYRVGKKAAGRLLDGVEHNGMPGVTA